MSLTNGNGHVSKETWDSHNKMMLGPLAINDSEVCVLLLHGICHLHTTVRAQQHSQAVYVQ